MTTDIDQWWDTSWNPITGCSPVSEGCNHCWAEAMTRRFWRSWGCAPPPNHFKVKLHLGRLGQPLRWKKPRRIFVCSMGDAFHEDADIALTDRIMATAQMCPQHTFICLTKRDTIMAYRINEWYDTCRQPILPNVWLGVTVENDKYRDRIQYLQKTRAAVRFISWEPALGSTYFTPYLGDISWLIMGCESGPKRRPCRLQWMVDVIQQCKVANVKCFVKQVPLPHCLTAENIVDKREATRLLDEIIEDEGHWRVSRDPKEWPEALRLHEYPEQK